MQTATLNQEAIVPSTKSSAALEALDSYSLHFEALKATELHQKSESYLLEVMSVVDDRMFYLECGVSSLYQYCVRLLGLSESVSYALIAVIRKSKEVPELKMAIQSGKVTLSKAKKICSVIDQKNFREWIDLAACETSRVIEKCVAGANPKELVKESAVYKTSDLLEFKLGVGEEFIEALAQVKDHLSQKESKAISSEEALLKLMRDFIEKNDPVKKAARAELRREKQSLKVQVPQQFPGTVKKSAFAFDASAPAKRAPIKRLTLHAVALRDQNQCTFTASAASRKLRCDQKRWLDVHHIVPLNEGGSDDLENLTTLCKAHHRMSHRSLSRSATNHR